MWGKWNHWALKAMSFEIDIKYWSNIAELVWEKKKKKKTDRVCDWTDKLKLGGKENLRTFFFYSYQKKKKKIKK